MTSLLILLGVVLSSLSVYVQGEPQSDFDIKKMDGVWYVTQYAYKNSDWNQQLAVKVQLKATANTRFEYIYRKARIFRCQVVTYELRKSDFNYFKGKRRPREYGHIEPFGSFWMTFLEAEAESYAYVEYFYRNWYLKNITQIYLLTREKKPSDAVIDKWETFVRNKGYKPKETTVKKVDEKCVWS